MSGPDERTKEDDVAKILSAIAASVIVGVIGAGLAAADEAPISGTAKAMDAGRRRGGVVADKGPATA